MILAWSRTSIAGTLVKTGIRTWFYHPTCHAWLKHVVTSQPDEFYMLLFTSSSGILQAARPWNSFGPHH